MEIIVSEVYFKHTQVKCDALSFPARKGEMIDVNGRQKRMETAWSQAALVKCLSFQQADIRLSTQLHSLFDQVIVFNVGPSQSPRNYRRAARRPVMST